MSMHKDNWIVLIVKSVLGLLKSKSKEDVVSVVQDAATDVVKTETGEDISSS